MVERDSAHESDTANDYSEDSADDGDGEEDDEVESGEGDELDEELELESASSASYYSNSGDGA